MAQRCSRATVQPKSGVLATYVPLIALVGRGGEYLTHLAFLLAATSSVSTSNARSTRRRSRGSPPRCR
jgi:hypothetical protein